MHGVESEQGAAQLLGSQSCLTLGTPRTVAHQAPLSMGFSRQEHWSGLLFLAPEDLPNAGIGLTSLMSFALVGGFFTPCDTWEAFWGRWGCFFPITKYRTNEQINELNNKYYMSLIVYRELFYVHPLYFEVILTILFSWICFFSFHLYPFPLDPRVFVFAHQIDLMIYP